MTHYRRPPPVTSTYVMGDEHRTHGGGWGVAGYCPGLRYTNSGTIRGEAGLWYHLSVCVLCYRAAGSVKFPFIHQTSIQNGLAVKLRPPVNNEVFITESHRFRCDLLLKQWPVIPEASPSPASENAFLPATPTHPRKKNTKVLRFYFFLIMENK